MHALSLAAIGAAIHFEDQTLAVADKIQNIATKRRLTAEMVSFLAQGSEKSP